MTDSPAEAHGGARSRRRGLVADESTSRAYSVVVPVGGLVALAVTAIAMVVALTVVERGGTVFSLSFSAWMAAVVVAPLVRWLSRALPRGAAVALVVLGGIVGVVGTVGVVAWDLDRQANDLSAALHGAVEQIPQDSSAADAVDDLRVSARIDEVLGGAAARVVLGDTDPIAVAGEVGQFILIAVLGAFMLTQGRGVLDSAVRRVRRASTRERIHTVVHSASARAGAFLRRTLVASLAHGFVVGTVAAADGLPGAITLGAWAAVSSSVPIVGGCCAWVPIVGLTLAQQGSASTPIVVAIGAVTIVAHALARHLWIHRALHVGPLLTLIGLGIGWNLDGARGALVGLLAAGVFAAAAAQREQVADAIGDLVEDPEPHADSADRGVAGPAPVALTAEEREGARIVRLRLSGRTLVSAGVLGVSVWTVFHVLGATQSFVIWLAIASFIGVGLDRPISTMERRLHLPRVAGIAIVLGLAVAVVGAVAVLAGPSITDSATQIVHDAPETVESLESLPLVGHALDERDASSKVEAWIGALPDRISDSDALDRVIAAAGDGLVGLAWTIAILLALLLDAPRLVEATRRRIPVRSRLRWMRFGRAAYLALSNVAAASFFVAAFNGSVVMLLALALGIPLAPVLGLWAMAWNFIPQIGGFVAAVPLVALGFGQGTTQGLVAFGVFITYQTFENHVIQPWAGSRAVRLPPLVVLSGALLAGALGGFVFALLAGPALGVAKVAADQLRPGPAVRSEDRTDTYLGEMLRRRRRARHDRRVARPPIG